MATNRTQLPDHAFLAPGNVLQWAAQAT
jgi:hypothetical protein